MNKVAEALLEVRRLQKLDEENLKIPPHKINQSNVDAIADVAQAYARALMGLAIALREHTKHWSDAEVVERLANDDQ